MRAAVFHEYGGPLTVEQVPDPAPPPDGVVLEVGATGICRSDWHAWQGHDPDVAPPHVPGHELAAHPSDAGTGCQLYLMCDEIESTVAELQAKGVAFRGGISHAGFGLMTTIELPGGGALGLYEPRRQGVGLREAQHRQQAGRLEGPEGRRRAQGR